MVERFNRRIADALRQLPPATRKTYRTGNQARAGVFDYIERFHNPARRHSTLGYLSPMNFEKQAQVA